MKQYRLLVRDTVVLFLIIWTVVVFYFVRHLSSNSRGGRSPGEGHSRDSFDTEGYLKERSNIVLEDHANERYVFDNFLTSQEIGAIVSMIYRSERRFEQSKIKMKKHALHDHKDTWFTNIFQLDNRNRTEMLIARKVRRRALRLVRHIFGKAAKIYVETCNFSVLRSVDDSHDYHLPGITTQTYSHGLHCDNCNLHYENMSCTPFWTHARHYTAVIYVKPADTGGEFVFYDFTDKIQPIKLAVNTMTQVTFDAVPGRIIVFDSGSKNHHAVKRMFGNGDRISVALWMTRDEIAREERRHSQGVEWLRRIVLGYGDDDDM